MSVRIRFLGPLADIAGMEECTADAPLDWNGLCERLGPGLAADIAGDRIKIACGGVVLADKARLCASDGDEIALLPPVSGG